MSTATKTRPLKLSREERKEAFAGTLNVLRRMDKPEEGAGTTIVLAKSRGGKQILYPGDDYKSVEARERLLERGELLTVEIPRQPTLWITLKGWHLVRIDGKDGEVIPMWETAVTSTDVRESIRTLGPTPGPKREAGLKTRWGKTVNVRGEVSDKRIPQKGEERESWTDDSERGYGGSARGAVDERAGVDDATLNDFSRRAEEESELLRKQRRIDDRKLGLETRLAETRSRRMSRASKRVEQQLQGLGSGDA